MKKYFFCIIPVIMLIAGCTGNAKPAANPSGLTLDQALKEAAVRIDERLAAKSKIAPLNFNSPHDKFSGYVLDELTANLVDSGKLTVVDRKEVNLIRGEFDFQFSGEVGDDSMQKLGRMLGAQSIISGSLTDMGSFYRIVIRVLNVQNASVEVQYRANIVSDAITAALLTGGKTAAAANIPQRTQAAQTGSGTKDVEYKVGGTGPAGGIIFYDKTSYTNGWRYLEAAPASTETRANWDTCVQMTQVLVVNGIKGWRLPTRDELNWMYTNLKKKGLGGFANATYWTSEELHGWTARAMNFTNGEWHRTGMIAGDNVCVGKDNSLLVRAVRAF